MKRFASPHNKAGVGRQPNSGEEAKAGHSRPHLYTEESCNTLLAAPEKKEEERNGGFLNAKKV